MSDSQAMTINLSSETIDFIRRRVESGDSASESDVVREGIESLRSETEGRERWEQEVLLPAHDRLMANPTSAFSKEEVLEKLEAARRLRRQAS